VQFATDPPRDDKSKLWMMDFHGSKMRDLVAILLCYALFQAVSGTFMELIHTHAVADLAVGSKSCSSELVNVGFLLLFFTLREQTFSSSFQHVQSWFVTIAQTRSFPSYVYFNL